MIKPNDFERKLINPSCNLQTIAQGLARIGRFGGRGRYYYPVLAHSFVVGDLMEPAERIYGYLHDMTDILMGDVGKPFKTDDQKIMEGAVHMYMLEQMGIPYPSNDVIYKIREIDREAAIAEAFLLELWEVIEIEGNPDMESAVFVNTCYWAGCSPGSWLSSGFPALFIQYCRTAVDAMKPWPSKKAGSE